jgi:pSer/pThr/pTyr-binding forkhead associated (FHA) protein
MTDNGSMGGTFVNGEPMLTGPLSDGDRIAFVHSGSKLNLPKLLVRIPPGTVMVTVAPPPPEVPLTAPAPPGPARPPSAPIPKPVSTLKRPAKPPPPPPWEAALDALRDLDWRSPKVLIPVGGLGLVLLGLVGMRLALGHAPVLQAVQPAAGEPGQVIALSGQYFAEEVAKNTVLFGAATAQWPATPPVSP